MPSARSPAVSLVTCAALALSALAVSAQRTPFLRADGAATVDSTGATIVLRGTNLGNWLVPEGYMFDFKGVSSPRMIEQLFRELVGPDAASGFWRRYLDTYITRVDIAYLAATGANHVRVPFHYKLFTDEPYLGTVDAGFEYLDRVVEMCRAEGLYVLLDMHCAPGGQTGDNIDDSDGYPFLLTSRIQQARFADIWARIAAHYRDEPVIAGYDLANEPVAHYFEDDREELEIGLRAAYAKTVAAVRAVDPAHLIFLNGSIWATDFDVLDASLDDNVVYEFHKYWMPPVDGAIAEYVSFRDSLNVPIYLGESGENTDGWVDSFRLVLDREDVGYAFWPYKKMRPNSCYRTIAEPTSWQVIKDYAASPRRTFKDIREHRPARAVAQYALDEYLHNVLFPWTEENEGYVEALGFEAVGE